MTERPAAIRLTDLADPVYPEAAQPMREALAGYGAMLQLDPEAMLATATERTGLDDWGDAAFRERLDVLCTALRDEAGLSDTGTAVVFEQLVGNLVNRLRLQALTTAHPEIEDIPVERPIIICGLPAHGHHASAQPVGRRPGVAPPAVLGEPRTVPVPRRTRRATPTGPVCDRTRHGERLAAGVQTHARHDR